MADTQTDAQAIAESVHNLDVHDRVGALKGIVNAHIHPEQAEDATGNPFKQSIYDGAQRLEKYRAAAGKVELLQLSAKKVAELATIDGDDWLQADLNDFSYQIETTFVDDLAA